MLKKLLYLISIAVVFLVGLVVGYLRGFEHGYNISMGNPYVEERQDRIEQE